MTDTEEAEELRRRADEAYDGTDYAQAAELYAQLLNHAGFLGGREDSVHWRLGMSYLQLDQADLALEQFQEGGFDESQYEGWMQTSVEATDDFDLACEAYVDGAYDNAAKLFLALTRKPNVEESRRKEIRWNLAMCFFRLDRRDEAVRHFELGGYNESEYVPAMQEAMQPHAQPVDVDAADAAFSLACEAYEAENYTGAADRFAALTLDPAMTGDRMKEVHWNLAMCHFHLGNDEVGRQQMQTGGFGESDYKDALERIAGLRTG